MKTLITFLLFSLTAVGQVGFFQDKFTAVNFIADPVASVNRSGFHIGAEIERVENLFGIKASVEYFPQIQGSYTLVSGSAGLNFELNRFSTTRIYAYPKIQMINRGGQNYASYGFDAGIDKILNNQWIFGLRLSYDYRTDFDFWGGKAEFRPSGFIKIGYRIK